MTVEEQIDEELKINYTLAKSNDKVKVWISKTEYIDMEALYDVMAELHKN